MLEIRPGAAEDYERILTLNDAAVPAVNRLSQHELRALVEAAFQLSVACDGDTLAGVLLAFLPGADYQSLNYQWFCERYQNFVYIDRIIVAPAFRGRGVGRRLYAALGERLPDSVDTIACEVNLQPPNPESQQFHARLGFVEVGRQDTEDGAKTVSLMIKPLVETLVREPLSQVS